MRSALAGPLSALAFLTVIPVPGRASELGRAVAYFPLVGLAIGAATALIDLGLVQVLPATVASALDLAFLAALTGGLHLDGLADSADGLLMSGDRAQRLAAMREPAVGAFGMTALVLVLLAEIAALSAVASADRPVALIVAAVLARWAMAFALLAFPYARPSGIGRAFKDGVRPIHAAIGSAVALGVAVSGGPHAAVALAGGVAVVLLVGRLSVARLGGLTGDVYGAAGELTFAVALIAWTIRV